ncbi:MAG: hypothetical protein ACXQTI_01165 [Candidatus Nezhaarchaeales archaeon]
MDKAERSLQLVGEAREGQKAEEFSNTSQFKEYAKELEAMYINAIRSGSWFKKRAREENCRRLQVLDDLVTIIESKIVMGEQALKRLESNKNASKQRGNINRSNNN